MKRRLLYVLVGVNEQSCSGCLNRKAEAPCSEIAEVVTRAPWDPIAHPVDEFGRVLAEGTTQLFINPEPDFVQRAQRAKRKCPDRAVEVETLGLDGLTSG